MKVRIILVNVFLAYMSICLCSCSFGGSPKKVKRQGNIHQIEVIAIRENTGEHENAAMIFYDSSMLTAAINGGKIFNLKSEANEFISSKDLVSKSGFYYLEEYTNANCIDRVFPDAKELSKGFFNMYFTQILIDTVIQNCYYYGNDMERVKNYFLGMKSWIEKSPYKEEFPQLLNYLDAHINNWFKNQQELKK